MRQLAGTFQIQRWPFVFFFINVGDWRFKSSGTVQQHRQLQMCIITIGRQLGFVTVSLRRTYGRYVPRLEISTTLHLSGRHRRAKRTMIACPSIHFSIPPSLHPSIPPSPPSPPSQTTTDNRQPSRRLPPAPSTTHLSVFRTLLQRHTAGQAFSIAQSIGCLGNPQLGAGPSCYDGIGFFFRFTGSPELDFRAWDFNLDTHLSYCRPEQYAARLLLFPLLPSSSPSAALWSALPNVGCFLDANVFILRSPLSQASFPLPVHQRQMTPPGRQSGCLVCLGRSPASVAKVLI
ncbi:hypothetical protein QBC44DRAFT_71410 [Cladorrhinum sp. PSN332]|nr:hypothetical protein QBC44DRAFT_71410 [Cladorrhinum sp. PSN332]